MRLFPKLGVLLSFASACTLGLIAVANAQHQANLVATPFVTAERPHSKHFLSGIVSTGKRNPYFVSTNSSNPPAGSYPGIILTSDDANSALLGLDTISFSYKGNTAIEAMVEYYSPDRSHQKTFTSIYPSAKVKGEFQKVLLNKAQLGIPEKNTVNKVVFSPASRAQKGKFLIDDIQINGNPVRKALDTIFYSTQDASPSGPLAALATSCTASTTTLTVRNWSNQPIVLYMQLQPIGGCSAATDVQAVFPAMTYVSSGNTTLGYMTLPANGTPGYSVTSSYTGPLSANFSQGFYNLLCGTNVYPQGINLAECTLNNSCQGTNAQETLDISLVNGLNAKFRWTISGGQSLFNTVVDTRPVPPIIKYVKQFENKATLGQNFNIAGVFPYGCTNCTNNAGAQACPPGGFPPPPATSWQNPPYPYGSCNPSWFIGCNLSRNASCNGGSVICTFLGPASSVASSQ
jgi:hypothetical protein